MGHNDEWVITNGPAGLGHELCSPKYTCWVLGFPELKGLGETKG